MKAPEPFRVSELRVTLQGKRDDSDTWLEVQFLRQKGLRNRPPRIGRAGRVGGRPDKQPSSNVHGHMGLCSLYLQHALGDELAVARDVLYHLLSDAGVYKMADRLKCDPKDVYNAIDLALHDLSLAKTEEE